MKNIFILFLVATFGLISCKKMLPTAILPYSMVKYQDNKFIDITEITVEQYAEFIYDGNLDKKPNANQIKNFKHYQVFYPSKAQDSLFKAFGKIDYYNLPVPFEYFDTLNYTQLREILDYPITGVSHANARAYCQWRTKKHNQQNTQHTKQKIEFTLPSKVIKEKEHPLDAEKYSHKNIYPVKSPKHAKLNQYKVFGLQSNVAEMTTTANKFYGEKNDTLIGFRCVGIVKD